MPGWPVSGPSSLSIDGGRPGARQTTTESSRLYQARSESGFRAQPDADHHRPRAPCHQAYSCTHRPAVAPDSALLRPTFRLVGDREELLDGHVVEVLVTEEFDEQVPVGVVGPPGFGVCTRL
jgi:hypothetical protein